MNCPRCTDQTLREVDRADITLDRCERCRGIWLDRGELEKLIARESGGASRRPREDNDDDDDDDDDRRGAQRGERRRSWWEIFD